MKYELVKIQNKLGGVVTKTYETLEKAQENVAKNYKKYLKLLDNKYNEIVTSRLEDNYAIIEYKSYDYVSTWEWKIREVKVESM